MLLGIDLDSSLLKVVGVVALFVFIYALDTVRIRVMRRRAQEEAYRRYQKGLGR